MVGGCMLIRADPLHVLAFSCGVRTFPYRVVMGGVASPGGATNFGTAPYRICGSVVVNYTHRPRAHLLRSNGRREGFI